MGYARAEVFNLWGAPVAEEDGVSSRLAGEVENVTVELRLGTIRFQELINVGKEMVPGEPDRCILALLQHMAVGEGEATEGAESDG